MSGKKHKLIAVLLILILSAGRLFALEQYVSEVYSQIDECFAAKDESRLNNILSKYSRDKYYYLMENYTQKKIRRLIVNNDYSFAMDAILAVIENNLDNEEAVEMYSLISEAYELQRKYELEQEQKRQLELARIEQEKEKQRGTVEKEYVSASKSSGGSVYVSGRETNLTSYNWKASLGMIDLLHLMDKQGDISSIHYGVSADFRYEYTAENNMVFGTDVFAGFQVMGFAEEEKLVPMIGDVEFAFKTAFPQISKNLFFRLGVDAILTGKSDMAPDTIWVVDNLYSPIIGLKFERIPLGSVKVDLGADWLAGHLFAKNVKAAGGASMNLELPFAEMEKVKLNFNIGLRDKFFLKDEGLENRASVILAIGVENVIR